eukprot:CAMPEP_0114566434 /NCGR_PEP_ID=MMETSP0114-20121206/14885_1 /TAXON_ID=31324 /ORGANISM="Goniomonas sp, Strain m" /LENGTH=105 /DNA_ID=CAMNT_0001752835 /DNA_START=193 /DNA_END=511 /DNA_ORIENTATION=+
MTDTRPRPNARAKHDPARPAHANNDPNKLRPNARGAKHNQDPCTKHDQVPTAHASSDASHPPPLAASGGRGKLGGPPQVPEEGRRGGDGGPFPYADGPPYGGPLA